MTAPVPSRRRGPLVLGAVVLVALLVAAVLAVRAARQPAAPSATPGPPVVVLYGYLGTTKQMAPLADTLRAAGRDVTVVDLPDHNTGDLRAAAQVVDETVADVLARTGAAAVDLVGHSAGGVLARYWVRDRGAPVTHRVVMLGSPNHGSDGSLVFSTCLEACQQLHPGSDFIEQLNSGDETPDGPTWVSLWSRTDGAVEPPSSSEVDGALNLAVQDVCADSVVEHADLPSDGLTRNLVAAELALPKPQALGPDDCSRLGGP